LPDWRPSKPANDDAGGAAVDSPAIRAGAALGIGMIGAKAVEAVGRNPGASGKVLTLSIIGMALSEAIAIYALILAFGGR